VCAEDRPLLGAIERLINKKIEVRQAEGFEGRGAPSHEAREERGERGERGGRGGRGRSQPRQDRAPQEKQARAPQERGAQAPQQKQSRPPQEKRPSGEGRGGRGRGRQEREDRAPRHATSPAPRTSGNSGGMDFSKPYEPSPSAVARDAAQGGEPPKKKPSQGLPALFRKKAA